MRPVAAVCLLFIFSASAAQGASSAWSIARDPGQERAVATAGQGATMNALAAIVGLDARVWPDWVTLPAAIKMADGTQATPKTLGPAQRVAPGQTVEVPNTVIAAWIGDFGELGRQAVGWREDIGYLHYRGFFVVVMDKPESFDHACTGAGCSDERAFGRRLAAVIQRAAGERDLHGLFFTSHGNCGVIGTQETNVLWKDDLRAIYPLALLIVNACHADTWGNLISPGGRFHGPANLMLPVLETGHPEELLAPGEQGTRRPPRRARPPRRTS